MKTLYLLISKPHFQLSFIACLLFAIYSKVPGFDFLIGWDDQWFVLNDYTTSGFSLENLKGIFTDFYYGQYAPLNQLYYTTIYQFVGYTPSYYHVLNVVIHFANVCLVYTITLKLSGQFFSILSKDKSLIAFFCSLLFAVLPINLEPAAWVAASKVIIYAFFYLLAINSYCNFLETQKSKHYYLTLLFFICSFGAKEQAVTLPACMFLLDYFYGRNIRQSIIWYEKTPIFLLAILFGLVTIQSQQLEVDRNLHFYPIHERVMLSFFTIVEYFTKTILPINISYLYPFPYTVGGSMPGWLWVYGLALPLSVALIHKFVNRWTAFGLLFFLIHILLVCNLFSLARHSIIADRYTYVSSFGICFIIACFVFQIMKFKNQRKLAVASFALYMLLLSGYTYAHSSVWQNANTLKMKLKNQIKSRRDYPSQILRLNEK